MARSNGARAKQAAKTKAVRRVERAKKGPLRSTQLKPQTRKVYWEAVQWGFRTLEFLGLELPSREIEFDGILTEE